jgi:predicted DsbA family dithiol-disulfide isomerase
MQAKGGGRVPLEQFFAAPRQMGAAVGLVFNFDQIERAPNTLLAQRLIAITTVEQRGALLDAVYAAYFEHGRDIGDLETLVEIAATHGMDLAATREQLAGDAGRVEVLADLRWAQEAGIGGVPFFVFDERYAVSGAQPPDVLLQVMEQVADGTIAEPDVT